MADRVSVMREGRIVQTDTPARLWRNPIDEWSAGFRRHSDSRRYGETGCGPVRSASLRSTSPKDRYDLVFARNLLYYTAFG